MKKLLVILGLSLLGSAAFAQSTFSKNDHIVSLGLGYGAGLALEGKWEMNVVDNLIDGNAGIGVGAVLGWSGYSERHPQYRYNYNDLVIGAQGNFHYQFVENLDTYIGLTLGFENVTGKAKFNEGYDGNVVSKAGKSAFYLGAQIGTRYYFNEHWAAMVEFGYGVAYGKIGVTYKF